LNFGVGVEPCRTCWTFFYVNGGGDSIRERERKRKRENEKKREKEVP